MPLIELKDITRSYLVGGEELRVLKGITLDIAEGEFVAIMGPSGSGKSTLMQIIGLLDRPSGGSYKLMGRDVSNLSDDEGAALRSRTIGFIFQMFNLLKRTSTLDNVALPLIYSGAPDREARATAMIERVGLGDRLDHAPNQLSGGQQQRVAIARALANRPRILFADEPTGNLASDQAEDILGLIKTLNREGITVIMVTHEPDIAAHARRIIRIKDGLVVADERLDGGPLAKAAVPIGHEIQTAEFSLGAVREYASSAGRAMAANKGRSFLSMLGIMIGVASVIAMLAIGAGAQKAIEARLASLGSNMIMIFARSPRMAGVRGGGGYSRLTLEDARAVAKVPGVLDIYPEAEGNVQVVYGNQNTQTEMQGVTPSYESIRRATPYYGRFFTAAEDQNEARVVILGQTVVNQLFGAENPVGRTVEVNHTAFKVIGILPFRGSGSGGGDQDDMIIVPINTSMKKVLGTMYLHEMAAECVTPESIGPVMQSVKALLRRRHRLPAYKDDDFTLRNMAEMQATLQGTTQTVSLLLAITAAISLFVGGVGIMNILLVSVNERTREIGLRKAVGASRNAVMAQFLIESLALAAGGGLMGVALGVSVSLALSAFAGWAAIISPQSVLLAFGFSAGVGVVFGLWPARKASLLSPIEALRYE
ncbi:MAG: ABC transporter permease [Elusimicrobiota bacterium]